MNCLKCRSGVMEKVGFIDLVPGALEMKMGLPESEGIPFLEVRICSRGDCGEVEFGTVAGPSITDRIGFIELKPGLLEMKTGEVPKDVPALEVMIGAKLDLKAAPDSLSLAKRRFREQMVHL
jgi:hypothetical protein